MPLAPDLARVCARTVSMVTAAMPVTTPRSWRAGGLAGERGQGGGDFGEAGSDVGRRGAGLAAAIGVAGVPGLGVRGGSRTPKPVKFPRIGEPHHWNTRAVGCRPDNNRY